MFHALFARMLLERSAKPSKALSNTSSFLVVFFEKAEFTLIVDQHEIVQHRSQRIHTSLLSLAKG